MPDHLFLWKTNIPPFPALFKAKEKIKLLEKSINEAQTIEKQILDVSQWINEVDREIQNRLDADVLAGDVPDESEVSYLPLFVILNSGSFDHYYFRSRLYLVGLVVPGKNILMHIRLNTY